MLKTIYFFLYLILSFLFEAPEQKNKKNQDVKEKQKTTEKRKNNKRRKQNSKLFIATLNVRSLKSTERLIELEQAVEKINWDIIGICETRREEEYIKEIDNRYIHFNKGLGKGRNGVGFIVKMGLKNKVKQFIGISDRIAILVVKLPEYKKNWTIVQIYAPHELTNELDKNLFYETLNSTLVNIKYSNLIIMGDFNSQLGKYTEKEKGIMGAHSFGKRNENGNRLINFAFEFNLLQTLYLKKTKTENGLGYLLIEN